MNPPVVDLRSDTVTRPTPAMRQAIAQAVVGDDVYGDDPTVKLLEQRMAERTGKAAAVFVPSGTMGNQIAIHCHTRPGDAVVMEAEAHIFLSEQGAAAANSGCLVHTVPGTNGVLSPESVRAAFRPEDEHVARVRLVCLENTHNRAGGVIVPLETIEAVAGVAHAQGARVHLDGARLWNVEVATGIPIATWAAHADTLMMCFSKGLGAPIGSILMGSTELIHEARRVRKRWGGGMRQVGLLAAAALHAMDHHVERLADDHRRARRLAELFRQPGFEVPEPHTNIVVATVRTPDVERDALIRDLAARGVWVTAWGPQRIRAITHLDVDDGQIERAGEAFREVVSRGAAPVASRR